MNNDGGIPVLDVKCGRRSISLSPNDRYGTRFNLSIRKNGELMAVIELDRKMVYRLGDLVDEMLQYIEDPK